MSSEIPSLPPLESAQPPAAHAPKSSAWRQPAALITVAALALLGWQWLETRSRLADLQVELTHRLSDGDAAAKETRALAKTAQDNLAATQAKLTALEARIAESQGHQVALEAMYQEFTRTRDDRVLAEVEQAVNIAVQQIQLASNVQAALLALQTADARLSSLERPQWLPLRKAIASDMDTLRSLPQVDSSGVALRLETLIGRIDSLPLGFEARPKETAQDKGGNDNWLQRLGNEVWTEFSQLVRIERMDRPDPALLAPSNAVFLRENLKLRLMNARLALLSRDGNTFREDMRISYRWLERYFDTRNPAVAAARNDLLELQKVPVGVDMPTLQASQNALRQIQAATERRPEPVAPVVPTPARPAARPAKSN
jgi:uroporphyrin-3 C-methyltransferase